MWRTSIRGWRLGTVAVAVWFATGCTSSESEAPVRPTALFETFFAGIDAMPDSFARERFAALGPELEATPADVICLQGLWSPADREALKQTLVSTYPYSVDLPTQENDSVDDLGPGEPASAPCTTAPELAQLDKETFCLSTQCSDTPGDPDGRVRSTRCVALRCALPPGSDPGRCHQCVHAEWRSGSTFREVTDRCRAVGSPLAHRGEHGLLLLSRHPLYAPFRHVLPSRWMRRAVVGATGRLGTEGVEIDLYCTSLGPSDEGGLPNDPIVHDPYPGEEQEISTWGAEQALQAERLVATVQTRSAGRRAIVLGAFNAGPQHVKGSGDPVVGARGGGTWALLSGAFDDGVAAGYEPVCTVCPDNPLRFEESWKEEGVGFWGALAPLEGHWTNRIFLYGIDTSAVQSSVRMHLGKHAPVALDDVLAWPEWPLSGSPQQMWFPLSAQYGFRSAIEVGP